MGKYNDYINMAVKMSFERSEAENWVALQKSIFEEFKGRKAELEELEKRKEMKENFYHGILLGILGIKEEWGVFSNQETGEGYSDILIETENSETAILIEVKYAGDGNLDVACERALTGTTADRGKEI